MILLELVGVIGAGLVACGYADLIVIPHDDFVIKALEVCTIVCVVCQILDLILNTEDDSIVMRKRVAVYRTFNLMNILLIMLHCFVL